MKIASDRHGKKALPGLQTFGKPFAQHMAQHSISPNASATLILQRYHTSTLLTAPRVLHTTPWDKTYFPAHCLHHKHAKRRKAESLFALDSFKGCFLEKTYLTVHSLLKDRRKGQIEQKIVKQQFGEEG